MFTPPYRQGEKPLHEYLRQHARVQGGKTAFIWYGRALSYAELDRMSDAFAARLAALGIVKGDRVALFLQNCPQYLIAHFGIQKLGAIVGPCSPLFKEHELQYQLSDLGAKAIVAADTLYPLVEKVRAETSLAHVFTTAHGEMLPDDPTLDVPADLRAPKQPTGDAIDFLAALEAAPRDVPRPEIAMDDVALMTYTSGSTGLPKGAMLTYGNALFKTYAPADSNLVRNDDILLAIAPLFHIAGMLMGMNLTIYTGATTVLLHRFDPTTVLQAIDRYGVTFWYGFAIMNETVMQVPDAGRYNLRSLLRNPATSFGITLTEPLARRWKEFTGNCQTYEATYGMSETHTWDTYMPLDAVRWGTHGKPIPGVECRIIDPETGEQKAPGELGEILMKSPGNFKGYANKPEATASTLRDGWVHTGDMGKIDSDGYMTFCGRFKEMIKVSGYSVFPEEVETLLIRHPAIAQAAVIGLPDPVKGQVVKAAVVLKPDVAAPSVEEILAWCRDNMSAYKIPREIEFRTSLPVTGTGKLLRRALKE